MEIVGPLRPGSRNPGHHHVCPILAATSFSPHLRAYLLILEAGEGSEEGRGTLLCGRNINLLTLTNALTGD